MASLEAMFQVEKPGSSVESLRIHGLLGGAGEVISRAISTLNGVTPVITLLINDLRSPLPLQVGSGAVCGSCLVSLGRCWVRGSGFRDIGVSENRGP